MSAYLVTFRPCGHVKHMPSNPAVGAWVSCWWGPDREGCQTPRQVRNVKVCPGCPACRPTVTWLQASLFDEPGRAAA